MVDSFELNDEFSIIEAKVSSGNVGKSIREINLKKKYNLLVLTVIKEVEVKSILGKSKNQKQIQGVSAADDILKTDDILVLFGSNKDLQNFLKQKLK